MERKYEKSVSIGMRDPLIDILKGIGIVSVVVGHSGILFPGGNFIPSIPFVYLYHLMIFFFTAGAVYNPKKYSDPFTYIGADWQAMMTFPTALPNSGILYCIIGGGLPTCVTYLVQNRKKLFGAIKETNHSQY